MFSQFSQKNSHVVFRFCDTESFLRKPLCKNGEWEIKAAWNFMPKQPQWLRPLFTLMIITCSAEVHTRSGLSGKKWRWKFKPDPQCCSLSSSVEANMRTVRRPTPSLRTPTALPSADLSLMYNPTSHTESSGTAAERSLYQDQTWWASRLMWLISALKESRDRSTTVEANSSFRCKV